MLLSDRNIVLLTIILTASSACSGVKNLFENCTLNVTEDVQYKFNVWVMVPYGTEYKFSLDRIKPAIDRALSDSKSILNNLNDKSLGAVLQSDFNVSFEDTNCDADWAPNAASDIHDVSLVEQNCSESNTTARDIDVVIGMSCDYAAGRVATLANHWKWPVIYPGSRSPSFDFKKNNPSCSTMVRPGVTSSDLGRFIVKLFDQYHWNRSMSIYSTSNSHGAYIHYDLSTDCGTLINGVTTQFREVGWNRGDFYDFDDSRSTDALIEADLEKILENFKNYARVSIWCVGRKTMRHVMEKAFEMGMTGGDFAFIYLDLYNTNVSYTWSDADDHPDKDTSDMNYPTKVTKEETIQALRALTVVSLAVPSTDSYKNFSASIKEELAQKDGGSAQEENDFINPYISYYYDAMQMFVYGVVKTFCSGSNNFHNAEAFAERLWGIQFESLGRNITFSDAGDQTMDYAVLDMNSDTNIFEPVLFYDGSTTSFTAYGDIDWPGTNAPINEPDCYYDNSKCAINNEDYTIYYVLGGCAAALLVACGVLMTVLFRNMRKEKRLRKMIWKVKWEDILWGNEKKNPFTEPKDLSHSIASSNGLGHHFERQVFTKTGMYKGTVVAVKELKIRRITLDRNMLIELEEMYSLDHDHICKFVGANDEPPHISILTEYCPRGSLQDLLENDSEYEMDEVFQNSLISDIVNGMMFIHRSFFQIHGNLKSSNCVIDNRFVVKLTDFGLQKFREGSPRTDSESGYECFKKKLWTAPELLRKPLLQPTPEGDVYSFAIIVQEIIFRKGVFYTHQELTPQEILLNVATPIEEGPYFRPTLQDNGDVVVVEPLTRLISRCWAEDQNERPSFKEIHREIRKFYHEKNLVDSLLERLEQYSHHLEDKVEERTELYRREKERADSLLYQMLPKPVAERLKKGNTVIPESFESVTIFFSDIVGFTAISHGSEPLQVVNMLNDLYTEFDNIIGQFDVYKVETIGDAYMVVSGLPRKNGNLHAREIARMSLVLLDVVANFRIDHMPDTRLKLRVGMHTGPVVAGVVGLKMPRYCLFGDTVNTASRMESNGKASAIHVSPHTKKVLDEFGTFLLEEREEEVFLKGLGTWKTWWLRGEQLLVETDLPQTELITDDANSLDEVVNHHMKSSATINTEEMNYNSYARSVIIPSPRATKRNDEEFAILSETLPKVQFKLEDTQPFHRTSELSVTEERKSGRDSGIGLGFDNSAFFSDINVMNDIVETDNL
ncbi:atrial natriuretic peptide receptor 1-like isoform X2 [Clavelina lepadiformis]|uniref:atrial natriuretic peptide receptor 1-like isoform X2 n=1 Tax=Clavelina lepadiformis TaxID=159417 RepID=UPI004042AC7F